MWRPASELGFDIAPELITEEEFQQLTDELTALLMRWGRSGQEAPADEDRQTYIANVYIQPRP